MSGFNDFLTAFLGDAKYFWDLLGYATIMAIIGAVTYIFFLLKRSAKMKDKCYKYSCYEDGGLCDSITDAIKCYLSANPKLSIDEVKVYKFQPLLYESEHIFNYILSNFACEGVSGRTIGAIEKEANSFEKNINDILKKDGLIYEYVSESIYDIKKEAKNEN